MQLSRRWLFPLLVLSTLLSITVISHLFIHRPAASPQTTIPLQQALLRKWLTRTHVFVPSSHPFIRYHGRWTRSSRSGWYNAGFAGASFEIFVSNTTSAYIWLGNTAARRTRPARDGIDQPQFMYPTEVGNIDSGPVNLVAGCKGSLTLYDHVYGIVRVVQVLDHDSVCVLRVQTTLDEQHQALSFKGLWLNQGAVLLPLDQTAYSVSYSTYWADETKHLISNMTLLDPDLIEIIMPDTYLRTTAKQSQGKGSVDIQNHAWHHLIADMHGNLSVSLIPCDQRTWLMETQAGGEVAQAETSTLQQLFFKSGPPGTDLFSHPWYFDYPGRLHHTPSALILSAGQQDIIRLLTENSDRSSGQFQHRLELSIDEFSRTYSNLIKTIRRTAYHHITLYPRIAFQPSIDPSYEYISAPSTLPIFLIIPPPPPSRTNKTYHAIQTLLRHATSKVLNDLKWHIGDKNTLLIDATSWLPDENDFEPSPHDHQNPLTTTTELMDFTLSESGHVKFAYHLSEHLCQHWKSSRAGKRGGICAFDRYAEYTGDLYLPGHADIEELIEERKVRGIKDWLGMP